MKFPHDLVPGDVWDHLENKIEEAQLEYADNYRAYRANDSFLYYEFCDAANNGCCGFFQTTVEIGFDTWVIGCNYGH